MAAQYPPYQQGQAGFASEASFDHQFGHHDSTTNLSNEKAGAGATGAGGFKGSAAMNSSGRSNKKWWWIGGIIAALLVVGAVLGGVLGTQLNKDSSNSQEAAVKVVAVETTTGADGKVETLSSTTTSTSSPSASATPAASVSPLPEWKWTQTAFTAAQSSGNGEPMYGAALGNWLILEQWMDEPCKCSCLPLQPAFTDRGTRSYLLAGFNASSGNNASVLDEWTLMQVLGDNARSVMTQHYETWITEDDIETIHQAGMNHIRIPVGKSMSRALLLAGSETQHGYL